MPNWYMDQGDGTAIYLAGEHATAQDADLAANQLGIFGTPVEAGNWEASPTVQSVELQRAKLDKLEELKQEGDRRCTLVAPLFDDVAAMYRTVLTIKDNNFTNLGDDVADVANAWAAASVQVLALPTLAAVQAYNVVTDPSWP